jgi:hypothetical protein
MNKYKLLATTIACLLSYQTSAKEWAFQVEPYLMGTSIAGDASIGRASDTPVDVDFKTILDNLDMAAMIHFEALHQSGWGLAMDYGFMDLGMKKSGNNEGFAQVKIRQGVLETLGFYRVNYGKMSLDYLAGVRWWDNDLSLALNTALPGPGLNIEIKEDWVDIVAGLRLISEINKDWHFMARADVGGFGTSADFTSTVETGFTYQISELMVLDMKYKASWVDYDNETNVGGVGHYVYDTITHGPILGLSFNF